MAAVYAVKVGRQWGQVVDASSQRIVAPEPAQVFRGQDLLSSVNEQPLPSVSRADMSANACCNDACTRTDRKVIVKHTFIEVVEPQCERRSRAMSDSALVLVPSDRERAWQSQPLATVTDVSDASTTGSEGQEAEDSQAEDLNMGDAVRKNTWWQNDESMGTDTQQQQQEEFVPYQYVGTWWAPMSYAGNTTAVCAAMPDGTSASMPQRWADESVECEGLDTKASDQEWRTTVMLRNMPNNYNRDMLLDLVDSMGFTRCYDFAYLPVDFKTQAGLGYAFINFVTSAAAQRCFRKFEGYARWQVPSEKVCTVTWGSPYQGFEAHVERYQNSPVMHHSIPDDWKPVLFDEQGSRIPFPPPTKPIKMPKVRQPPTI